MTSDAEAVMVVVVPIEVVYRAARDLVHYPLFMVGARAVTPVDGQPDTFHWVGRAGVRRKRWRVVVSEQEPVARIAWRSAGGGTNSGAFTLEPLGDQTRVSLRWRCDLAGGSPDQTVTRSLANFKRAVETGQRQIRPVNPRRVVAGVATVVLVAGIVIGMRLLGVVRPPRCAGRVRYLRPVAHRQPPGARVSAEV